MGDALPKVLIVANCLLNDDNATSITLKNMFGNWPKDRLAIVYTSLDKSKRDSVIPMIHISDLIFYNPTVRSSNLVTTMRRSGSVVKGVVGATESQSLKKRVFNFLHTFFTSHKALLPYKAGADLDEFIEKFKPDVIYSPLGSIAIMKLVRSISKKFQLSIIPHFMDDWIHTMYENDVILTIPVTVKRRLLRDLFKSVKKSIVISEKMGYEYTKEFGGDFYAMMNCVPDASIEIRQSSMKDNSITFCYFGGLHLLRWKSLKDFCAVLSDSPFQHLKVNVNVYTSDSDRESYQEFFKAFSFVKFCEKISNEDVRIEMQKGNFLLHVESFDKKVKAYTRLSISTKIPEYLSAGRPIVAIGPPDVASIEYLQNNKCAHIITDFNANLNGDLVTKLTNEEYNKQLVSSGKKLFLKFHECKKQYAMIEQILKN